MRTLNVTHAIGSLANVDDNHDMWDGVQWARDCARLTGQIATGVDALPIAACDGCGSAWCERCSPVDTYQDACPATERCPVSPLPSSRPCIPVVFVD